MWIFIFGFITGVGFLGLALLLVLSLMVQSARTEVIEEELNAKYGP
ncbi:hypothetical protein [Luteolibacter luteus]|uniref:Uncharacterized protein n=1 Tax=Luteolibacter luteus TaxID=2728835 RepID=A0A858RF58_9BACT|nr:hypothetical protein [Luteolibacter luteus]QJE95241.1 hypothetical protein HHL09_05445 [Luteolibacter luteus]